MSDSSQRSSNQEHIVILGAGFAGWYAARALAPRLRSGHRITLVDRVDHMLYTPMLTEVAGGNLQARSISVPARVLPSRVCFLRDEVSAVNTSARTVTLATGQVLHATQIVLALGSTTAYHHVPGARQNSLPLKTAADARAILSRIDDLVSEASATTDPQHRRELLSVVVAGGGYTGVETVAAVVEHLGRKAAEAGISRSEINAVLIEPTERLMHETPANLASYSQQHLESCGIRVLLGSAVDRVDGRSIHLSNGEQISAGVLIWDTGIEPSPLLKQLNIPLGKHGGAVVDACFQVKGVPGLWALGDCAEIPSPDGKTYAPTAQNATREGVHLAQNVSAVLRGDKPRPFRFTMLGQLALLSDRKAVAEIFGVKLAGTLPWALWWVIYVAKLPHMSSRLAVLRDLASPFGSIGQAESSAAPALQPEVS